MKFNYLNRFFSVGNGAKLGCSGCYGGEADSPEHALQIALDGAASSRKIMGFPIVVKTEFSFERQI